MGMPSWPLLFAVAGGCGMGVGAISLLLLREKDRLTNQAAFIAKAVDLLKEQPATKDLLGENIKVGKATVGDGWSKLEKLNVQVRVPIKGENDNAYLYAYARRPDENSRLRLYKLEATFSKVNGKKLVLMDRTDQEDEPIREDEPVPEKKQKPVEKYPVDIRKEEAQLSAEEKRRKFIEDMKGWHSSQK